MLYNPGTILYGVTGVSRDVVLVIGENNDIFTLLVGNRVFTRRGMWLFAESMIQRIHVIQSP